LNTARVQNHRQENEESIATNDLGRLLMTSGMLNGHFCPFLAVGVKAAARAVNELAVRSTGMEETITIVETKYGESVMETRVRSEDSKPICIPCTRQEYYQLAGNGISIEKGGDHG
jgi:formylmethanofuran dehydrogenase subunit E